MTRQGKQTRPRLAVIIRDGEELFVAEGGLTAEEREEIAERKRSPEARKRFGARLREVRRIRG